MEDPVLQRRKKRNAGKMKDEEVDTEPVQIVENHEAADGGELHEEEERKKKRKKKMEIKTEEVDIAAPIQIDEAVDGGELHEEEERKKKRKKKKMEIKTEEVDIAAPIQIDEAVDGGELHEERNKKKMKMEEVDTVTPTTMEPVQIVEAFAGGESHEEKKKKRRKKKMMAVTTEEVHTVAPIQIVEELHEEKRRRREKMEMKVQAVDTVVPMAEPVLIVETVDGGESHMEKKRRRKKKKKMEMEEVAVLDDPILQLAESCGIRRKKHKTSKVKVEETGDVAHTLQSIKAASCGESHRRNVEEFPNEHVALDIAEPHKKKRKKEISGNGFVYGKYSAEEDAKLKQAIFDFIREKDWEREDGIHKIIRSKSGYSLGCWPAIGKCLPHRAPMGIYARAHKLFGVRFGRWTSAEVEALKELHSIHGSQWNKISQVIGRDRTSCCLKWHNSVKWSKSLNQKTGRWSPEERRKLCTLVLKFLHEKRLMAEKGQLRKNHKGTRDDINWVYIAEHMDGRSGVQCANHWYFLSRIDEVIC